MGEYECELSEDRPVRAPPPEAEIDEVAVAVCWDSS